MKTFNILLIIGALAAILPSCNYSKEKTPPSEAIADETFTDVKIDGIGSIITDGPEAYFYLAEEAFLHKEFRKSADALKAAAKEMENISKEADQPDKSSIDGNIRELYDLESNVAYDKVDGINELTTITGKAFLTLAKYRLKLTEKLVKQGFYPKAAANLNTSLKSYNSFIKYHNYDLQQAEVEANQNIQNLAKDLENGVDVDQMEVEKIFNDFEEHLALIAAEGLPLAKP